MKTLIRKAAAFACTAMALLTAPRAQANNIQVTNPTLTNGTGGNATIQFDLSWENSWRGGGVSNWDAAWVFVKYYSGNAWHHAYLNNSGHVPASGSQIDVGLLSPGTAYNSSSNPVMGAFVYRNADGTGNLSLPGTQLGWNYGAQGLVFNDISKIQVLAIETVYVPFGAFGVGGGGLYPFNLSTIDNYLSNGPGGFPSGAPVPLIYNYPNGVKAFYCMRYELSQQGYVDFLNTLTYPQQVTRTASLPTSAEGVGAMEATNQYRNGIDIQTPGVASATPAVYACNLNANAVYGEATDGKDIACNYLNWDDLSAYLDWTGLRPMTELEFEKACRGTVAPVTDEYPWGTSTVASIAYDMTNSGAADEAITTNYSNSEGNANYNTTDGANNGPMRVGIFSANSGNTGRVSSGASFYGIMELGGNVVEKAVTVNNNALGYSGTHGNGTLSVDGNRDAPTWPEEDGSIWRGGSWTDGSSGMRVSDRYFSTSPYSGRLSMTGGRGVRSAP